MVLLKSFPGEAERVDHCYQMLFGRHVQPEELEIARTIIASGGQGSADGWNDLLHVLLCSNEFVYVD